MTWPTVIFTVGIIGGLAYCAWRVYERQLALDADRWPKHMSVIKKKRFVKICLRNAGWEVPSSAQNVAVFVRAFKGGYPLTIFVPENNASRLQTIIRDGYGRAYELEKLITILVHGFHEAEIKSVMHPSGVWLVNACELFELARRPITELPEPVFKTKEAPATEITAPPDPTETQPTQHKAKAIKGLVGSLGPQAIRGWAYCAASPNEHLGIEIMSGERLLGQGVANIFRKDIEKAGIGKGDHAFQIALNDAVRCEDTDALSVFATNAAGAREALPLSKAAQDGKHQNSLPETM